MNSRGPIPGLIGWGLEKLYRAGLRLDQGRKLRQAPEKLGVPVLSVGNITVGGTGKTPVVEALARSWLSRGGLPGILSRGYRSRGSSNDEYQLLERRISGVPHVAQVDRYQAGRALLAAHPEVDLIILDDGFQHLRLARDLDLVLIDATRPFGGGRCLPWGWLREPVESLFRADAILITRVDHVSRDVLGTLESFLSERAPDAWIGRAREKLEGFRDAQGRLVESLPQTELGAFCAIGNPSSFFETVKRMSADDERDSWSSLNWSYQFRDHHAYRENDLERVTREAKRAGVSALVTTEKDGVKLEALEGFASADPPIYQLRMRAEFDVGAILERLSSQTSGFCTDSGKLLEPGKD